MVEAALALRVFHLQSDQLVELPQPPATLPAKGFVWIGVNRAALEATLPDVQSAPDHRELAHDVVERSLGVEMLLQPGESELHVLKPPARVGKSSGRKP